MRRFRRRRHGQSLVEFALMGPIFFVLLMGTIDLGRAIYIYNTISDAAREGARAAVPAQVPVASQDDIVTAINTKLGGGFFPTPCTAMQNPPTSPNTGVIWFTSPRPAGRTPVTVQIVYYFSPFVPFVREAAGNSVRLKAQATMVTEY